MGALERLFSIDSRFLGVGAFQYSWHPSSTLVAAVGSNNVIQLFDSRGALFEQVVAPFPGDVTGLQWDAAGERLAVLTSASNGRFALWSLETKRYQVVQTKCKDLSMLRWSQQGLHLGLFGSKGRILVYNRDKGALTEVALPSPTDRIIYAEWEADILAVVYADRRILVVDKAGSVLEDIGGSPRFRLSPVDVQLCRGHKGSIVLSVNLENKTIFLTSLFHLFPNEIKSYELQFPPRCGTLVSHKWQRSTGELFVCFSSGTTAVVPALEGPDIAARDSVFAHNVVTGQVRAMAISSENLVAIAEDDAVRIFPTNLRSQIFSPSLVIECDRWNDVESLKWAPSAPILSLYCPSNGCLHSVLVHEQRHNLREMLKNMSSSRALFGDDAPNSITSLKAWRQANFAAFSLSLVEPMLAFIGMMIVLLVAWQNDLFVDLADLRRALRSG